MTDDLSMAAASTALGITPAQAAVKSLTAGADVAMGHGLLGSARWSPIGRNARYQ
jgi:beta-glucosidase-like glycosyl hydrolase